MIELIVEDRCVGCDRCVAICPTNVFDAVPGEIPIIGRQEDCHTCMSCELHCPVDALYVSPRGDPDPSVDPAAIIASGMLGSYRRALGWKRAKPAGSENDPGVLLKFMRRPDPEDKVRTQLYELAIRKYI